MSPSPFKSPLAQPERRAPREVKPYRAYIQPHDAGAIEKTLYFPEPLITPVQPARRPTLQSDAKVGRAALEAAAERYSVTIAQILGPSQQPHLVAPRCEVSAYLRYTQRWSFPRIGRLLGRHHSSIIYYLQIAQKRCPAPTAEPLPVDYVDLSGEWAI